MAWTMIVIGLTGSIGMGKSTTAAAFRRRGVPVQDADRIVHGLLAPGGAAVSTVETAFPGTLRDGGIDRTLLGKQVFGDPAALKTLEGILHPLVGQTRLGFLKAAARRRQPVVVVDVPLLFETGGDASCDLTVLVTAPEFVQRARVMARPGMTQDRLSAIRAKQMRDAAKRRLADIIIPTGNGKASVDRTVAQIVRRARKAARAGKGRIWPPRAGRFRPRRARPVILESLVKSG